MSAVKQKRAAALYHLLLPSWQQGPEHPVTAQGTLGSVGGGHQVWKRSFEQRKFKRVQEERGQRPWWLLALF